MKKLSKTIKLRKKSLFRLTFSLKSDFVATKKPPVSVGRLSIEECLLLKDQKQHRVTNLLYAIASRSWKSERSGSSPCTAQL